MNTTSNRDLVARALEGDQVAFRAIVDRYEGIVAGVVIRMLGPGDEADDVGQEVFIRLYRSLSRFRGDAALKTYLVKIAMNLSLTALKRRKRAEGRASAVDLGSLPETKERASSDAAETAERTSRVRAALNQLDPKHRAVVVMRMMEGHSTKETARALKIPEGTVLSRLARALKKLRPHLEPLREL